MSEMQSVEMNVKLPKPNPVSLFAKIVLILGVVAVAGVAAFMLINRAASPTGDPTANVMPANTLMFFAMTTHPDKQPNFNVVADAWKGSKEANQLQSGLVLAVVSAGFNWDEDIVPWLGERVGIGLVDLGGADQSAPVTDTKQMPTYRAPFFLIAAQTRDHVKSDAFLAALAKRIIGKSTSMTIQNDTYRGIPLAYIKTGSDSAAWATVNDLVVVTIGPDNLKKAIDAALDGKNLAASDNFKATMAALPGSNVGAMYMDFGRFMTAYMSAMTKATASTSEIFDNIYAGVNSNSNATPDPNVLQKQAEAKKQREEAQQQQQQKMNDVMQAFGGVGIAMTYEPSGIRFDTAMQFDPAKMPEAWRSLYPANPTGASNKIFDSIPSAALLAMNANMQNGGLKILLDPTYWQTFNMPGATGVDIAGKIAQFEKQAGVDLKADLLDLFNGEFAFVVLPKAETAAPQSNSSSSFSVPFQIAAMFDASDANHASSSLDKIISSLVLLAGDSGLQLQPMNRAPYTALLDKQGNVVLAYGVVNNRLVIGSNPDTLDALAKANSAPLSADATFKSAIAPLPSDRLSTTYIQPGPFFNWYFQLITSAFSSFGSQQPQKVDCGVCNYFQPIRWISSGSEAPANGLQRESLHIGLQAAK